MPSAPKAPPPIDQAATLAKTSATNTQFGQQNQAGNAVPINSPIQNTSYTLTIDPITGQPKYVQNTNYSPQEQGLFDTSMFNKAGVGGTASDAISNMFAQYGADPNLIGGTNSLTSQFLQGVEPNFNHFALQARQQKDTELKTAGIMPGTPAYQQQMDLFDDQSNRTLNSQVANFMPQAFDMTKQQYQLPLTNVAAMMGLGSPDQLQYPNLPQYNAQTPDVLGITQAAYDSAMKNAQWKAANQNSLVSGIMGGVGKVAGLGTGGGSTLGGDLLSGAMFL